MPFIRVRNHPFSNNMEFSLLYDLTVPFTVYMVCIYIYLSMNVLYTNSTYITTLRFLLYRWVHSIDRERIAKIGTFIVIMYRNQILRTLVNMWMKVTGNWIFGVKGFDVLKSYNHTLILLCVVLYIEVISCNLIYWNGQSRTNCMKTTKKMIFVLIFRCEEFEVVQVDGKMLVTFEII